MQAVTDKYIIIGAGPAGVIAAEALRKVHPDRSVTIISDEHEPPYSRMALPYYMAQQIDEAGTHLRKTNSHFSDQGISIVQDKVTSIDTAIKKLSLKNGDTQSYDKLLIASGSQPIRPPIPGMDLPNIHNCWTLEDGRAIVAKANKGSNVILMGAGFIGCIILEALASCGVNLTVIEMEDRMVPRMMDQNSGQLIKKWCQAKGISVHTATRVQAIEQDGSNLKVVLDNGQQITADLVISATGVKPNIQFLQNSDIKTDLGILVNNRMQSSDPNIYAAGDVCQGRDFSTGEYSVQAIQPTAADHGRIAAMNMSGKETIHQGSINLNVLDTLGLISSSYGLWGGVDGGDTAELYDADNYRYINLQFQDDILIGAQSLGLTQHVGVLRGLIQSKLKLGKWKDKLIQNPTHIMEAYLACTQAIGHNIRII
ncbi:Nitrite reductase probable [NAD(P)H] subunit [uncultured Candidatus Thioglobus sp.]|nr:Nitrite reductase probable [NAD(P)H] subunit [uncultured Candidatus Thioglobus sp.]